MKEGDANLFDALWAAETRALRCDDVNSGQSRGKVSSVSEHLHSTRRLSVSQDDWKI